MPRPRLVALELPDDPAAMRERGFAVAPDGTSAVASTAIRFGAPQLAWALDGADASADGLRASTRTVPLDTFVAPATNTSRGTVPADASHALGVVAVDHVVVATPDLDRTVAALEAGGLECRRTAERGPLRQAFLLLADALVEVVAPKEAGAPSGPFGTPAPEDPATLWGVTLVCADLDAAAALLGDRTGPVKDAVQPGRRITTLRRGGGVQTPVALMSPRR